MRSSWVRPDLSSQLLSSLMSRLFLPEGTSKMAHGDFAFAYANRMQVRMMYCTTLGENAHWEESARLVPSLDAAYEITYGERASQHPRLGVNA